VKVAGLKSMEVCDFFFRHARVCLGSGVTVKVAGMKTIALRYVAVFYL